MKALNVSDTLNLVSCASKRIALQPWNQLPQCQSLPMERGKMEFN